jgi:hypothetical protein
LKTLKGGSGQQSKSGTQIEKDQRKANWEELTKTLVYQRWLEKLRHAADPTYTARGPQPELTLADAETGTVKITTSQTHADETQIPKYVERRQYCPFVSVVEINVVDIFNPNSTVGTKMANTLDSVEFASAGDTRGGINVVLVNVFQVLQGNPQAPGIGENLIADVDLIRTQFENLFKTLERRCWEQRVTMVLSLDSEGDEDAESMGVWNTNLTTNQTKMAWIKMVLSIMQGAIIPGGTSTLRGIKFVSCCAAVEDGKHNTIDQGAYEVAALLFAKNPAVEESAFYNQLVSVQKKGIAQISNQPEGHRLYVQTAFASVHQEHASTEEDPTDENFNPADNEIEIHPPDLQKVTASQTTAKSLLLGCCS